MSLHAIKTLQNSVLVQNFKVLYVFPIFKNKNKNAFSVPTPFSSITKLSKLYPFSRLPQLNLLPISQKPFLAFLIY